MRNDPPINKMASIFKLVLHPLERFAFKSSIDTNYLSVREVFLVISGSFVIVVIIPPVGKHRCSRND